MTNEEFIESISLDGEEWRSLSGYENYYKISNKGRVLSLGRTTFNGTGYFQSSPKILKPWYNVYGYVVVTLCVNGQHVKKTVHRLVAQEFLDNPNNYDTIDHIDTVRDNNCVENLRWCTRSMNMMNPITIKKMSDRKKGKPSKFRKPVVQILKGEVVATFIYLNSVKNAGFTPASVHRCCRKLQPEHAGYQWMYKTDYDQMIKEQSQ